MTATLTKESSPVEVRTAWVDALRSGEYDQGRGALRTTNDYYCCLGVLCDLAVKADVIPPPQEGPFGWCYSGLITQLDDSVGAWAGVHEEVEGDLASMNDNEGKTFEEIAEVIEEWS